MLSASQLSGFYIEACNLDVQAFKPGNVSVRCAGHDMQADDFVVSAHASAGPITAADCALGERIHHSIAATHEAVGQNTNLGIVLLCAPLIQVSLTDTTGDLRGALQKLLNATTIADAEQVYDAIRLASPAGLGSRSEADVAYAPEVDLRRAMQLAADHDLIAAQYANGFEALFTVAVPYLKQANARSDNRTHAITDLYLFLLSRFVDSHITRKYGVELAREVQTLASETHEVFLRAKNEVQALDRLEGVDSVLKSKGINPGTTADFCVASLLLTRLLEQPAFSAGKNRSHTRTLRPTGAEVPHLQSSQ